MKCTLVDRTSPEETAKDISRHAEWLLSLLQQERAAHEATKRELETEKAAHMAALGRASERAQEYMATADQLRAEVERLTGERDHERRQANEWLTQRADAEKEVERLKRELTSLRTQIGDTFPLARQTTLPGERFWERVLDGVAAELHNASHQPAPSEPAKGLEGLMWKHGAALPKSVVVAEDDDLVHCELAFSAESADSFIVRHNEAIHHADRNGYERARREMREMLEAKP